MNSAQAIRYILANNAGVAALVGTRISPLFAGINPVFPLITYAMVSSNPIHAMGSDAGLERPEFQVTCFAGDDSYDDCVSVSEAVKTALQDFSGTISGFVIQRIFYENKIDLVTYDPKTNKPIYQRVLDFRMWHEV